MLHLYFKGQDYRVPTDKSVVRNVEHTFLGMGFTATPENKKLVYAIDQGELLDRYVFIDRFGQHLYTDCLSTGCKAALLVQNTDKVIDLCECGLNAVNTILSVCKEGYVLMEAPGIPLEEGAAEVVLEADGKVFHSIAQLNEYLEGECFL